MAKKGVMQRSVDSRISMSTQTAGELAFESFCQAHKIPCKKVEAGSESTPDYKVVLNGATVYVEVKTLRRMRTSAAPLEGEPWVHTSGERLARQRPSCSL